MFSKHTPKKLSVAIIGESIAGAAMAVLLPRLCISDIKVFESFPETNKNRGAGTGIVLPQTIVDQCKEWNVLDQDIPHITIQSRSWWMKDEKQNHSERHIWEQSLSFLTFNWNLLYENLHKRVPKYMLHDGEKVLTIEKSLNKKFIITTSKNKKYEFDFIIGADGVNSTVRKIFTPQYAPQYAGYIAWRGVTNTRQFNIGNHMRCYVFPGGHLLMYAIPAADYAKTKEISLNWVLYEKYTPDSLADLLVDKNGQRHTISLPPGSLSDKHLTHFKQLTEKYFPPAVAKTLFYTPKIFIQPIWDLSSLGYLSENICCIGDAFSPSRPHIGSGALQALIDSFSLFECFKKIRKEPNKSHEFLQAWNKTEIEKREKQIQLAQRMGKQLVTNTPEWHRMSFNDMEKWWQESVMGDGQWYAVSNVSLNKTSLRSKL